MSDAKAFSVGDRVRVITLPPYVKTAEPMPMLRPPNVISLGEEGVIVDYRPGGYWSVRFTKGAFLIESHCIESVDAPSPASEASAVPDSASEHTSDSGILPTNH